MERIVFAIEFHNILFLCGQVGRIGLPATKFWKGFRLYTALNAGPNSLTVLQAVGFCSMIFDGMCS